jgi:hypothetical protein
MNPVISTVRAAIIPSESISSGRRGRRPCCRSNSASTGSSAIIIGNPRLKAKHRPSGR